MDTASLPPVFVSHGSPMTALEPGTTGPFWRRLGPALHGLGVRPRAIVAVSAHTLAREPVVLAAARHGTVHDFGGFPQALYRLRYDCDGAPELATQVERLLADAGIPVQQSASGGLDHGIWIPLRTVFPDADVPVVPLGWPPHWSPAQLFALGQALAPLTREGVWILASGSITHNLGLVFQRGGMPSLDAPEMPDSAAFRSWWVQRCERADWPVLLDYRQQAPAARDMHPTDEHLLPWFVAAGAGGTTAPPHRLHNGLTYGCLGMDAYAFGPRGADLAAALGPASI